MTANLHQSHRAAARAETEESQVDLLVARIDDAYDGAGRPGAIAAVRELLRRAGPTALASMVGEPELEAVPLPDEYEDGRLPQRDA
jgi:hypothetical protein